MSHDLKEQEYHFFIFNSDNSHTFLISPTYEHYLDTIEVLKNRENAIHFFVIKGMRVYDTNSH
jgi:hypothetical protein